MMRVECVHCQQRQACLTPPEGPSLPDSYDVLLEKTSELRHAQQIVYIVERRTTQKKLNLQCLIASTSLKLSEIVANKSQQLKCDEGYQKIRKMSCNSRGISVEMTYAFTGLEGFCTIFVSFREIGAESRTFVVSAWRGDSVCVSCFQYLAMILNQKKVSCCFRKI